MNMQSDIYIRPLRLEDALISYEWRNNPKLWRLTGNKPDTIVTPEMETEWLQKKLALSDEKRFAICLQESHKYIGNVFLTGITSLTAMIHIFIGDLQYWGGNRAIQAILLTADYGFDSLLLSTICCHINPRNLASLSVASKTGFHQLGDFVDESVGQTYLVYELTREDHLRNRQLQTQPPERSTTLSMQEK